MHVTRPELTILYKDRFTAVVDKPGGLLSVPGRRPENQDCVVNRLRRLYPDCIKQPAVHRLDMYTSGLMVLALTKEAHRHLCRQFEQRSVEKLYIAVLNGIVSQVSGEITLAFRLDTTNRPHQVYDPARGKPGTTVWKKLQCADGKTRVEFRPLTGRTHQLRLHAAHALGLNCPIAGDRLYGGGAEGEPMLLHASYLSFQHPDSGRRMEFSSPAPF
ncbi:MAG: RluA family pseudouridine synthase [Desulfocapsaceae bacterium]|nr:RluA family pseudouridine synthase [Desulfocapsaceae bacterium]